MSSQPLALRPHDVCVALQLRLKPEETFRKLALEVGLSLGEAHNAVQRLVEARLILPHRRVVNKQALVELVSFGVPYVFPGVLGPETQGVPTAHSGPALREAVPSGAVIVWPSSKGQARGAALHPLCPRAAELIDGNPELYRWLTLVDALRVGRAREKNLAQEILVSEVLRGRDA